MRNAQRVPGRIGATLSGQADDLGLGALKQGKQRVHLPLQLGDRIELPLQVSDLGLERGDRRVAFLGATVLRSSTITWAMASPCASVNNSDSGELLKRDKVSLDLFWIKDKSLTDTDALPAPDILAAEIADDLEASLEQFIKIASQLRNM